MSSLKGNDSELLYKIRVCVRWLAHCSQPLKYDQHVNAVNCRLGIQLTHWVMLTIAGSPLQAYEMRPSIIFFDEIDGLAPVRSSRQDQIHSSIVSTLLALMDGIDSRGEIVVIGATNRIDSIDPALRRPGRFDREFHFPLPNLEVSCWFTLTLSVAPIICICFSCHLMVRIVAWSFCLVIFLLMIHCEGIGFVDWLDRGLIHIWEEFRNVCLLMTWIWQSWGDPVWLTGH